MHEININAVNQKQNKLKNYWEQFVPILEEKKTYRNKIISGSISLVNPKNVYNIAVLETTR